MEKILDDVGAFICNHIDYPTNFHNINGIVNSSIIDLVIASPTPYSLIKNCITLSESAVDIYQNRYYHLPLLLIMKIENDKLADKIPVEPSYNYEASDWDKFKECINQEIERFNSESKKIDIETLSTELMKIVKNAADNSIPKFKISNRIINFPPEIMNLYRLKKKCKKQHNKTKSLSDKENLDAIKSILVHELNEFRSKNWNDFNKSLGKNILSAAPFWKRISRLNNNQTSEKISPLVIFCLIF